MAKRAPSEKVVIDGTFFDVPFDGEPSLVDYLEHGSHSDLRRALKEIAVRIEFGMPSCRRHRLDEPDRCFIDLPADVAEWLRQTLLRISAGEAPQRALGLPERADRKYKRPVRNKRRPARGLSDTLSRGKVAEDLMQPGVTRSEAYRVAAALQLLEGEELQVELRGLGTPDLDVQRGAALEQEVRRRRRSLKKSNTK